MHHRTDTATHSKRPQRIAYLYGIWLSLDPMLPFVVQLNPEVQNSVFLAIGAGVAVLHLMMLQPAVHTAGYAAAFFGAFAAILITSLLVNAQSATSVRDLIIILPMLFVMSIALLVASEPSRRFVPSMLESFAIAGGCGVFLYIWWYAGIPPDFGARMKGGHLNPNTVGMLCASVACASLAVRSRAVQAVVIAIAFVGLYLSQSRSNMLGVSAAFSVVGLLFFFLNARSTTRLRIGTACAILVVLTPIFYTEVSNFVSRELMHADDPHRGLDTGATGRVELWFAGLGFWQESPLFGHGYRANERLYVRFLGGQSHNGYIALLVDIGVVGLIAYVVLVGTALRNGLQMTRTSAPREWAPGTALLISYLVMAMFERFALNAGNAMSIIFILICFRLVESPRTLAYMPARQVVRTR